MMKTEEELIFEKYSLLLEKDHRKKMISFGIPEDVVNYLHGFNDKYSIWFANEFKRARSFQNAQNKLNWVNNQRQYMTSILDWIRNVPNINLKDYDYQTALDASREYHSNLKSKTLEGQEKNTILKKYDDGFYWVDLEANHCDEESDVMGHCGRTSAETMYSLRKYTPQTQSIEAFVTIAANPSDGSWQQAKGKKNSKPKTDYWKYIADILVDKDMLVFKSEHNIHNDFTNNDLRDYIESNKDEFENADEIIEKIDDNSISIEDFEKYLDEQKISKLKYLGINIQDDELVYCDTSVRIEFDLEYFEEYYENVKSYLELLDEGQSELLEIASYVTDFYVQSWAQIEVIFSGDVHLYADIYPDDRLFSYDDDGLSAFKGHVDYVKRDDKTIEENIQDDPNYYNERLKQALINAGVLPDPDDKYSDIKPKPRIDPNQMEFNFGEKKKYNFKKIFYS
jgi:hypothetical protein